MASDPPVGMTREAFIAKWRVHLAGLALYGVATEATGGPLVRAARALEIPGQVESLLSKMFDSLQPPPPKLPSANGKPAQQPERTTK